MKEMLMKYGWVAPSTFDEQLQTHPELEQDGTAFDFQPEVPWNHNQYNEHYTSAQQNVTDQSYWMHLLSYAGYYLSSIQDPQTDHPSLARTSISQQADKQQTASKDSNQRIHKCTALDCKVSGFRKLSDLRRHQHSHEAPRFFCPVRTCKFHTRGFKRKDNLTGHQKRVHEADTRASVVAFHDSKPSVRAEPIEDEEIGNESPPSALTIKHTFDGNLSPKEFSLAKLAELRASRRKWIEEKDEEIRAVEKTWSLM